jgi:serine/threonine protein kinase
MSAMVTCLDDGVRLALDDVDSMYTYNVFAQNTKTTFAEPNRANADTFDLEGMHIGVSGSSMEWIRHGASFEHEFSSEDSISINSDDTSSTRSSSFRRPCLDDYTLLKVLGKGSFGKVLLVRKKANDRLYAMKVLRKDLVVKRRQVAHTKTERLILSEIDSPFVIKLHAAFQCDSMLYLVLDYCPGGELFFHLNRAGVFPENVTRFYAAELVLALADLHQGDVVYRDLKPENVLLDHAGHVKLADFGLCKREVSSSTSGCHSLCGTPEYLAPEILSRTGHGKSVDWWALGMLVFEMFTGLPPWYAKDRRQLLLNLRAAPVSDLVFPPNVSAAGKDFVLRLLNRDPSTRLGTAGGALELQQHPFFFGLDWTELREKKTPVPIKPCKNVAENSTSTHNFAEHFTRLPVMSVDTSGQFSSHANVNSCGLHGGKAHQEYRTDDPISTTFDGFTCGSESSCYLQASLDTNMNAMMI